MVATGLDPRSLMTALIPDLVLAAGTLIIVLVAAWRPASDEHQSPDGQLPASNGGALYVNRTRTVNCSDGTVPSKAKRSPIIGTRQAGAPITRTKSGVVRAMIRDPLR